MDYGNITLVKPTGTFDKTRPQFIGFQYPDGAKAFAKPCYSFGEVFAPSPQWLDKYKDEILLVIGYEGGNPDYPIWFGYTPLSKISDVEDFPEISIKRTEKFVVLIDDKNNKLSLIQRDSNNSTTQEIVIDDDKVFIKSGNIHLGGDDATEPVLFGDKTTSFLSDLLSAIEKLTVPTATGPSGIPINIAAFTALKTKLDSLKSKISKTK